MDDGGSLLIPPFETILKRLGVTKVAFINADSLTVPVPFILFLLRAALKNSAFNEAGYLLANPDIAEAVIAGAVSSARDHYIEYGYFEGRGGALPAVHEEWYLRQYPDVDNAVKKRALRSASQHFAEAGARELRAPAEEFLSDVDDWDRAFRTSA